MPPYANEMGPLTIQTQAVPQPFNPILVVENGVTYFVPPQMGNFQPMQQEAYYSVPCVPPPEQGYLVNLPTYPQASFYSQGMHTVNTMPQVKVVPMMPAYQQVVPQYCGSPALSISTQSGPSVPSPSLSPTNSCDRQNVSLSQRLEDVWHPYFDRLFASYGDGWTLAPIGNPKDLSNCYHRFMDSAKVRFMCPNCNNCWTSMKGRVYFMYFLDENTREGRVFFTLIGQKCSRCPDKGFVHAMWYPDEVRKVVENVHAKVGMSYYGHSEPTVRLDRRRGQPKRSHLLNACQACHMGICTEEHNFR